MTTRLFASWVRRGATRGIIEPDSTAGPFAGPATFKPSITLARDGVPQPSAITGPELPIVGPGAVIGIDAGAIVRTDPAPGSASVEDNFLPLVELARPDLPWLFTPARPSDQSRLRPWIVLIAVQASKASMQPGTPLPRVTVPDSELPDLNDSWAWAHAQVTVEDPADGPAALDPPFGGVGVSRLLCPRRLLPDTPYLACIVPATFVGVQAGLGIPLDRGPAIAPAWTVGGGQDVTLPVYYSWTFTTGDDGDFKSLVQRLKGILPDSIEGFGTRTVDISAPWESAPQVGDGMTIEMDGALGIGVDRSGTLTEAALAEFQKRLTRLLDFPADLNPTSAAGNAALSAVAPPIYGGRHAGQVRVPADTTDWLNTLNLDPNRRIAAAFGTQYVQEHQEFLMARAWDQLGAVREANRLRAQAELSTVVADRLHFRHIGPLGPSALMAVASPARTRVTIGEATTMQATVAVTPMPAGSATVAFSRFSRPLGPVGRRAFERERPTVIEQGIIGALQVPPPHSTVDGIAALEPPLVAGAKSDATFRMSTRAWARVTALEQAIPPPGDLSSVRQAIVQFGAPASPGGFGLPGDGDVVLTPPGTVAALDAGTIANAVKDALLPSIRILRRLNDRVVVPDRFGGGANAIRVMAYPEFPAPLALVLQQKNPDYLLPGLGNFPDDRVTLLVANTAFIESFLVGANHEMNRELLWREYPTDQRGTPFTHFWPRPDGNPDIPPITSWTKLLGSNGNTSGPDVEKMVVLLVRGEVLRRYPRTIVYAAPGKVDGNRLTLDASVDWTPPQFLMRLDARTTVFAYPLTPGEVHSDLPNGKAGFYFVFSEPVTGPRFNFDATPALNFQTWNDLDWGQVNPVRGFAIAGRDLGVVPPGETGAGAARWNNDACDMARIAFARPFRIAYHADKLLARS